MTIESGFNKGTWLRTKMINKYKIILKSLFMAMHTQVTVSLIFQEEPSATVHGDDNSSHGWHSKHSEQGNATI